MEIKRDKYLDKLISKKNNGQIKNYKMDMFPITDR